MGRRGAVEVPRRRLGRALGRAARRRGRDAGVREPALRAGRARAAARGPVGGGGRRRLTAADDGRDAAPARRRRRARGRGATFTGERLPRLGGRAHRRRLRRAGEHPRLGRDRRRARRDVRGDAAGRSPSGCSTASPPRRPPAATGAASSRRRCSSSSGTAATPGSPTSLVDLRVDDHERPIEELRRLYEPAPGAVRRDAARSSGSTVDDGARAPSSTSGSRRLGYDGDLDATGPAPRTSRSASTATSAIDPVVLRELRRATMSGYEVRTDRRARADPGRRGGHRWRPIRRPLGITRLRHQRVHGRGGRRARRRGARRDAARARGALRRRVAAARRFTLDGDEVDVAGGHASSSCATRRPKRARRGAEDGTTVLAVGGKPGEAYEPSAWEYFFAAYRTDGPRRLRGGARDHRGRARAQQPDHPALLYNRALHEALLGRRGRGDRARCGRALELEPTLAEVGREGRRLRARSRDDPEFLAITGQAEPGGGGS